MKERMREWMNLSINRSKHRIPRLIDAEGNLESKAVQSSKHTRGPIRMPHRSVAMPGPWLIVQGYFCCPCQCLPLQTLEGEGGRKVKTTGMDKGDAGNRSHWCLEPVFPSLPHSRWWKTEDSGGQGRENKMSGGCQMERGIKKGAALFCLFVYFHPNLDCLSLSLWTLFKIMSHWVF